ncbi:MAG: hypothetical protein KDC71_21720 [Acidobacteria bacterium]|nr:hypothetical protein [Acidobacteriota bacterium]
MVWPGLFPCLMVLSFDSLLADYRKAQSENYVAFAPSAAGQLEKALVNRNHHWLEPQQYGPYQLRTLASWTIIADTSQSGWGWFAFNPNSDGPVLVVPHAFYDRQTAELGLQLFATGRFRAIAINTAHRSSGPNQDWARLDVSPLLTWTHVLAQDSGPVLFMQIHGFSMDKHPDLKRDKLAMVLSSGSEETRTQCACVYERLVQHGFPAALYGWNAFELGGSKNAQYKALQALPHTYFVHLEIGDALRKQLIQSEPLRGQLIDSLRCHPGWGQAR